MVTPVSIDNICIFFPHFDPKLTNAFTELLSSVTVLSSVYISSQTNKSNVTVSDLYDGTREQMCLESYDLTKISLGEETLANRSPHTNCYAKMETQP